MAAVLTTRNRTASPAQYCTIALLQKNCRNTTDSYIYTILITWACTKRCGPETTYWRGLSTLSHSHRSLFTFLKTRTPLTFVWCSLITDWYYYWSWKNTRQIVCMCHVIHITEKANFVGNQDDGKTIPDSLLRGWHIERLLTTHRSKLTI